MYLLLPLLAAIIFALGSMVFKRAYDEGAGVVHAVVVNNPLAEKHRTAHGWRARHGISLGGCCADSRVRRARGEAVSSIASWCRKDVESHPCLRQNPILGALS